MKKLFVLMLVLGLATISSAAMMQLNISVNGDIDPADSEYTVLPSGTARLDIHSPNGYQGVSLYFALVCDTAVGMITGGAALIPPAPDMSSVMGQATQYGWTGAGDGIVGCFAHDVGLGGPGTVVDYILFHCESPVDAVIKLWSTYDEGGTWNLEDTVIIHQPEPVTIALLGLGGLFLRRRK